MRTNSLVLHGIRDKHDVFLLSDERRESLKAVVQAAAFLVASIGSGSQADNAEYGESIGRYQANCRKPLLSYVTR